MNFSFPNTAVAKIPECFEILLFASTNKGKLTEVREIAKRFGVTILEPSQCNTSDPIPSVDEYENTYLGNAQLKAAAFQRWSDLPTLADDTGLEIAALGGAPGVYSARFSGLEPNPHSRKDQANTEKVLTMLDGIEDRRARFVCVLYLIGPDGITVQTRGELAGYIASAPRGAGGFGYDNIFIVSGSDKTLAEIKQEQPGFSTHRTAALEQLLCELR